MSNANARQVGGTHYQTAEGEQHWDRIYRMFGPGYLVGCATKYVERYQKKNGFQDLEKAAHYIQKLMEKEYPGQAERTYTESEVRKELEAREKLCKAEAEMYGPYDFPREVDKFNQMYGLARPAEPKLYEDGGPAARLREFKRILLEEVDEVDAIITKLETATTTELNVLVDIADWLGDIQVYAASEMCRWGIPWKDTLQCIMRAQWTKLQADGTPMVRDGKVQKGPNYVAPEPLIRKMLISKMNFEPTSLAPGYTLAEGGKEWARVFANGDQELVYVTAPVSPEVRETHEDDEWQCEGFYGDMSQLYRHRKGRVLVRADSLAAARAAHAIWGGNSSTHAPTVQHHPV